MTSHTGVTLDATRADSLQSLGGILSPGGHAELSQAPQSLAGIALEFPPSSVAAASKLGPIGSYAVWTTSWAIGSLAENTYARH